MSGPGPKWQSPAETFLNGNVVAVGAVQSLNRSIVVEDVRLFMSEAIYVEGSDVSGRNDAANGAVLTQAGIAASWPIFKGRCRAASLPIPGFVPGDLVRPESLDWTAAALLRVFCQTNMPDLIDPVMEQPRGWGWW